jgi:hypothetical protein
VSSTHDPRPDDADLLHPANIPRAPDGSTPTGGPKLDRESALEDWDRKHDDGARWL